MPQADLPHDFRAALDLSTWTETRGFGSVDAVICPHCEAQHPPRAIVADGVLICSACRRFMKVKIADSPMGRAYMTWPWPAT